MSLADITRRMRGRAVEPVAAAVAATAAAVVDMIGRITRMSVDTIDAKLAEARAAEAAAEAAHREAAADYNLGFTDDEKTVAKRRKELVAAKEKVEDLLAARAHALLKVEEQDADVRAEAAAEKRQQAAKIARRMADQALTVEGKLDDFAAALAALHDNVVALAPLDKDGWQIATDTYGAVATLTDIKLRRFGVSVRGSNIMLSADEANLSERFAKFSDYIAQKV